ncbi:hypothetical protein [Nocardia altamirensis]|uniref:hypothetical protein n=1 Tax=Nocardia altamirensis TaxID=472158 RepID=UPI0008400E43|nr:hypothetical protein [Nocardia altamirensis]
MPAAAGTSTAFRLARIAAFVLGCLLFLYACETSKSSVLADKWVEVALAGGLLVAGLGAAWFEIKLRDFRDDEDLDEVEEEDDRHDDRLAARMNHPAGRGRRPEVRRARADVHDEPPVDRHSSRKDRVGLSTTHRETRHEGLTESRTAAAQTRGGHRKSKDSGRESLWQRRKSAPEHEDIRAERTETGEFLVESEGWSVRAKITRSGDLIFHGHDLGGTYRPYEWMWIFHPDAFPAIRTALGDDDGDLLVLLEEVVPQLDRHGRHDPGAWLRAHGIPATYREKGVSATQDTRELPLLRPGLPRKTPSRADSIPRPTHRNDPWPNRSGHEDAAPVPRRRAVAEDPAPEHPQYAQPEPRWIARQDPAERPRSRPEQAQRPRYAEPERGRSRYDGPAPSDADPDDHSHYPKPRWSRHEEAEAAGYEHLSPQQRPRQSRYEQPTPNRLPAPPVHRGESSWQPDEYAAPWPTRQSEYDDPPPARRHRSSPPPSAADSGRPAPSHRAAPPWP